MLKLYGLIPDSTLRRMRFPRSTREAGTGEKGKRGKGKGEWVKAKPADFPFVISQFSFASGKRSRLLQLISVTLCHEN
jgi:hypothetical protein